MDLIRRELDDAGIDPAPLARWLDPEAPPDAGDLIRLLAGIRERAAAVPRAERSSLGALGAAIAEADGAPPSPAERLALARLETALGLTGPEAVSSVLEEVRPIAELPDVEPEFDVEAMARFLDGDAVDTRLRVRALLSDGRFEHVYGLSTAEYRERVLGWCRILAEEGLGALAFPAGAGGSDDPAAFVAAFETLAFFDLSLLVKFGVQFGLFGGSVHQLGSAEHHERHLAGIGSLALPGCFAMSETGHGSNVYDIETTAVYDPATREFEIHTPRPRARKDWIGNAAAHGRLATVFAQLEVAGERHGVHAFLVPIRDESGAAAPGVTIQDCGEKLGLNGVDNGRLSFDGVRVPRSSLLDRFAWINDDGEYGSPIASPAKRFFTMLGTLVGGRIAVGSAAVSASKVALTIAVRYGSRRRQFGPTGRREKTLLDYPAHQRKLMPGLATTYALNFALHDLQARYVAREGDRRRLEASAAGLKALATRHATELIQTCREACGGQGYLARNRFGALKADTDVFTTFEGDNTVLLQLLAKDLLTGFRQQFGDVRGIARFVAERARTAVAERNPITTRKRDEGHLRDPELHRALFEAREHDLVASLARRVRARMAEGVDGFDALVACQNHALVAARAHAEREVLDAIIAAEGAAPRSSLTEILDRVRALFALATIERHARWYLESGYLDAPKSKAIREQVTRLCAELRPQAVPLVDAFDVPHACLDGSIAL